MSGVRMVFSFNDRALRQELRAGVTRLDDKTRLLKTIGEEMLPRINKRFKDERGPDGKRWAPLSSRTIAARLKRYGNSPLTILRMRGHLAGSISYQVGGNALKIGTNDDVNAYAGIHQFGGKAGRGRKVTIKARPYLGFADDDMGVIEEEVMNYLDLN
ncbi:phage virion morphogenesis protein [Planktotalea sp.]|uniref:phage virion morphogenesis protein n=1 Tax=Planktotalea sp. TaxID=2029877 RepID=UPI003D6BE3DF